MKNQEENIKVYSQVSKDEILMDCRLGREGISFGKVSDVANQYGIHMESKNNGYVFSAPKSRMQIFVEKLHFSQISYVEV